MTQPAGFRTPPALAAALAPAAPRLTFPALGSAPLGDLAGAPRNAEFLAVSGRTAGLDALPEFPGLSGVWATGLIDRLVRALAAAPRLRALWLYQVGRADLSPLGALVGLEHLSVAWAPRLVDLGWLARLGGLRTLYVDDAPRLDLATLPALPSVRSLHLGGGMDAPLRVASLAPLGRAPELGALSLANVRVADGSLAPLAALGRLRHLHAPNVFAVEESARLAAARPDVAGAIMGPIYAVP